MKSLFFFFFIFLTAFNCMAQRKQRITTTIGFGLSLGERLERELSNTKDDYYQYESPEGITLGVGYDFPLIKNKITLEPRLTYGYYKSYPRNHISLSDMKSGDTMFFDKRYYNANIWQIGLVPHFYYDLTEGDGDVLLTAEVELSFANISGKIDDNGSRKDFRKGSLYKVFNTTLRTGILFSFDKVDFYPWMGFSSLRFKEYLNTKLPENTHDYSTQEALFSLGVTFKFL